MTEKKPGPGHGPDERCRPDRIPFDARPATGRSRSSPAPQSPGRRADRGSQPGPAEDPDDGYDPDALSDEVWDVFRSDDEMDPEPELTDFWREMDDEVGN